MSRILRVFEAQCVTFHKHVFIQLDKVSENK